MPPSFSRCTSRSRVRAEVMPMPLTRGSTIDAPQPFIETFERRMTRQIDLQRCHRYEPVPYGVEIRARTGFLLRSGGTHPIDRSAAWILGAHDRLGAMPESEPRRLQPFQVIVGPVRNVDVEYRGGMQRRPRQLRYQLACDASRSLEVSLAARFGAERNREC